MQFHYLSEEAFKQKRALGPFLRRILQRIFWCCYRHKRFFWRMIAASGGVAVVDALLPLLWLIYIDHWIPPTLEGGRARTRAPSTCLRSASKVFVSNAGPSSYS